MRNFWYILSGLVFLTVNAQAQPKKVSLSGSIIKLDSSSTTEVVEIITLEDFRYIPKESFYNQATGISEVSRTKPGVAFLASAIVPGSGQALNGKWGRAATYFLIDALGIVFYIDQNDKAKRREQAYENYGDQNWSVLAYAQWLVEYSRANGIANGFDDVDGLEDMVFGKTPTWGNTQADWDDQLLPVLRQVEVLTPFYYNNGFIASTFSHVVQDYGSQQYYELMSKYYQFQPGWRDFHEARLTDGASHVYQYPWDATMATANFLEGRDRAQQFNDNYRTAGNILTLMMVNHIVSAFDAYFTVQLKNSRLEAEANMLSNETVSLRWHF
ncbi:MAG: hypothetical protein ED557_04900 [Balneola sp.]|nr:MAG: hypothetical protein ED557_04900 [Balneola sp.]